MVGRERSQDIFSHSCSFLQVKILSTLKGCLQNHCHFESLPGSPVPMVVNSGQTLEYPKDSNFTGWGCSLSFGIFRGLQVTPVQPGESSTDLTCCNHSLPPPCSVQSVLCYTFCVLIYPPTRKLPELTFTIRSVI